MDDEKPSLTSAPVPIMPAPAAPSPTPRPRKKHSTLKLVGVVLLSLVIGASFGILAGHHWQAKPVSTTATSTTLGIPEGATLVSSCNAGVGAQYVLPKDIPYGPIYNVYQGKVIGLEFMTSADGTASKMTMDDMQSFMLHGLTYDHMTTMLMPAGHAGFSGPHVMTDVMLVPESVTNKITCNTTSTPSTTDHSTMKGMSM